MGKGEHNNVGPEWRVCGVACLQLKRTHKKGKGQAPSSCVQLNHKIRLCVRKVE